MHAVWRESSGDVMHYFDAKLMIRLAEFEIALIDRKVSIYETF